MMDEIPRDEPDAILRANDSFKLSPLGFQLFLALHLFAFLAFLEIPVDRWSLGILQFQLAKTAFVLDRYCSAIHDRKLDVINVVLVPKYSLSLRSGLIDGCTAKRRNRAL